MNPLHTTNVLARVLRHRLIENALGLAVQIQSQRGHIMSSLEQTERYFRPDILGELYDSFQHPRPPTRPRPTGESSDQRCNAQDRILPKDSPVRGLCGELIRNRREIRVDGDGRLAVTKVASLPPLRPCGACM